MQIDSENTIFILLSFEGPDRYSLAGGLGVRVTNLSQELYRAGFQTHLFFVGDPRGKGEEIKYDGGLVLHRWCQWISQYYPNGVYQGENEKLFDFNRSIPDFLVERIIKPAAAQNKLVVILGEEWHTSEVMWRTAELLQVNHIRDRVVMFWNANNTFGFNRIDWNRLSTNSTVTTVSRYMKHIMWGIGVDPLVIPNGIPSSLLNRVNCDISNEIRKNLNGALLLSKIARWDPDKRWNMAVEATARLKNRGRKVVLLARGGMEPHGEEVKYNARCLGLTVRDVEHRGNGNIDDYVRDLAGLGDADILNLKYHCPQDFLRLVYNASDAVLANSGHEPFGLVGLETMAAGGVAFTGGTGEDYTIPFHNSIVLETAAPQEIEEYVIYLDEHPEEEEKIRKAARQTAKLFTWEEVIRNLVRKLEYQARIQGIFPPLDDENGSDEIPGYCRSIPISA
jgi:glycosyltransferase involved in cell wall biosynthesis